VTVTVHDDLEMYLCAWFRGALAARPEAVCQGVEVVRVEPSGPVESWPARLLIIRDDGTSDTGLLTGSASVGLSVLAGTRENPHDAKELARIVRGLVATIPSGDPNNPVAAVLGRNGPFLVSEPQPRARVYQTAELAVVERPL
jgi:hypothetical protein